jgi:hypothetical protein
VYAINFTTPTVERQRYGERGRQLCAEFQVNNNSASLCSFVTRHLGAIRGDVVHDLLAHMAERMIEMHKEKQGQQRAFRLDLGGYLDERQMKRLNRLYTTKKPPREGIRNYERRLASYREAVQLAQGQLGRLADETLNLEDFWRLSQGQWMWLLRQNLGDVADMGALVGLYDDYRGRLTPLMRTIQRTDWLIDQVVYQLYGLTEDEIAVVEGHAQ